MTTTPPTTNPLTQPSPDVWTSDQQSAAVDRWNDLLEREERQRGDLQDARAAIVGDLMTAPTASVRLVARLLGIGKSTVHDLQRRNTRSAD